MKSPKIISIVIVDDHDIFREGVKLVLNQVPNFEVIADFSNGNEYLTFLESTIPSITLMDINMPQIDGIQTSKKALKAHPNLKIITLSMFSDLIHYSKMIEVGVKGFVVKNANKEELYEAIKSVDEGSVYFSPEIMQKMNFYTQKNLRNYQNKLSQRELEILHLLCIGKKTKEIAAILFISTKTVEAHRYNIFKKANVRNIAELIIWAVRAKLFLII